MMQLERLKWTHLKYYQFVMEIIERVKIRYGFAN